MQKKLLLLIGAAILLMSWYGWQASGIALLNLSGIC